MKLIIGEKQFDFEYRLNSMCELERVAGAGLGEVLAMPRFTMYRYMMWAGLLRNHDITLEQVGDLLEEYLMEHTEEDLSTFVTNAIVEAGFMTAQGKKKAKK